MPFGSNFSAFDLTFSCFDRNFSPLQLKLFGLREALFTLRLELFTLREGLFGLRERFRHFGRKHCLRLRHIFPQFAAIAIVHIVYEPLATYANQFELKNYRFAAITRLVIKKARWNDR